MHVNVCVCIHRCRCTHGYVYMCVYDPLIRGHGIQVLLKSACSDWPCVKKVNLFDFFLREREDLLLKMCVHTHAHIYTYLCIYVLLKFFFSKENYSYICIYTHLHALTYICQICICTYKHRSISLLYTWIYVCIHICTLTWVSLVAQWERIRLPMQEVQVWPLGQEDSPGEGNGSSLQFSCLENSMDRGAWWAAVHGVTGESVAT